MSGASEYLTCGERKRDGLRSVGKDAGNPNVGLAACVLVGAEEGTHNADGESGSAQGQSHPGGADTLAQQNDLPWERENNCRDI